MNEPNQTQTPRTDALDNLRFETRKLFELSRELERDLDTARRQNAVMRNAIEGLEFATAGRLPADSSDMVCMEAIHIRRVLAALSAPNTSDYVKSEVVRKACDVATQGYLGGDYRQSLMEVSDILRAALKGSK